MLLTNKYLAGNSSCDEFNDCDELLLFNSLYPFFGPRFFGGGAFDIQP